jgi:hypothetical protein
MPLSPQEEESKAQMLVNEPGYDIPPDIVGVDRSRIQARADVIRNQNAAIARLYPPAPPPPAPPAVEPEVASFGGKRRKSKRSKRRKSKRNRKSRR